MVDGAYFIDGDGDLFEHLLRYLRRGVLPIFYDNVKGHDHAKYLALLREAEYFHVDRVQAWIENKEYLKAVTIQHTFTEMGSAYGRAETAGSNVEVNYVPVYTSERLYACPRGIPVHDGKPDACGLINID